MQFDIIKMCTFKSELSLSTLKWPFSSILSASTVFGYTFFLRWSYYSVIVLFSIE